MFSMFIFYLLVSNISVTIPEVRLYQFHTAQLKHLFKHNLVYERI